MTWDPLEEARTKLVMLSIPELMKLKESIDAEVLSRVAKARREGVTWAHIADYLGCSLSEAHRRYAQAVNRVPEAAEAPTVLPGQTEAF